MVAIHSSFVCRVVEWWLKELKECFVLSLFYPVISLYFSYSVVNIRVAIIDTNLIPRNETVDVLIEVWIISLLIAKLRTYKSNVVANILLYFTWIF